MTNLTRIRGYHGESGLCVLNATEKDIEKATPQPLSDINRECLTKRANEIALQLVNGGTIPEEGSFWSRYMTPNIKTGATQAGTCLGTSACETYGAGYVNKAVAFISRKVMGPMNERLFNGIVSGAQMAVTPKVLPYITAFSAGAGGIALPAAIGLVSALYGRLLASGKYTLETLPPPDQLMRYDNKCFFDAEGDEIGEQGLKDLQILITEYDLICKILASNREDVSGVIMDALNFKSKEFKKLRKSQKLALEEKIEKMMHRLQENNKFKKGAGILPALGKLAARFIPLLNSEKVEEDQKWHTIFASMDAIAAKISIPSSEEQEFFFDDATTSFYAPQNRISRWWYGQKPARTAEKVSTVMKSELLSQCKKIEEAAKKLKTVSLEELETFREKIFEMTKGFATLYKVAQSSHANEPMLGAFDNLLVETKMSLDASAATLALKCKQAQSLHDNEPMLDAIENLYDDTKMSSLNVAVAT